MLDIRFSGVPRFVYGFVPSLLPDNTDGPALSEAMAGGRMPSLPMSGINWTRHIRPQLPMRRARHHLTVIK